MNLDVKMGDPINFYVGREIFITGGTGALGKALVEKLLRSCSDLKRIYLLIRPKKGKTPESRLEELLSNPVFSVLKQSNPEIFKKLTIIPGNITEIGLGISEESFKLLENVSIVFHSAANVSFDEPLKNAIINNVRSTREMCLFAERLKHLEMFMHVSTIYSNSYLSYTEEKLYPAQANWELCIKMAETLDGEMLNAFTKKFIGGFPNTYTFTKHLSEYVANDFKDRIPIGIFRPSILVNAVSEPMMGAGDSTNGPVGLVSLMGAGLLRVIRMRQDLICNFTPIDLSTIALLIVAWDFAMTKPKPEEKDVRVFNASGLKYKRFNTWELMKSCEKHFEETPILKSVGVPKVFLVHNKLLFRIGVIFLQVIPSILLDMLIKLCGYKPVLMKLQRLFVHNVNVLDFFLQHMHTFEASRVDDIIERRKNISPEFEFLRHSNLPMDRYVKSFVVGCRRYILKEDDDTIPLARKINKTFKVLTMIIKALIFYYIGKCVYFYLKDKS